MEKSNICMKWLVILSPKISLASVIREKEPVTPSNWRQTAFGELLKFHLLLIMFGLAILLLFSRLFCFSCMQLEPGAHSPANQSVLSPLKCCIVGFCNLRGTTSRKKACEIKFLVEWGFNVLWGIKSKNQKQAKKNQKQQKVENVWHDLVFVWVLFLLFSLVLMTFFSRTAVSLQDGDDVWRSVAEPSLFCPLFQWILPCTASAAGVCTPLFSLHSFQVVHATVLIFSSNKVTMYFTFCCSFCVFVKWGKVRVFFSVCINSSRWSSDRSVTALDHLCSS